MWKYRRQACGSNPAIQAFWQLTLDIWYTNGEVYRFYIKGDWKNFKTFEEFRFINIRFMNMFFNRVYRGKVLDFKKLSKRGNRRFKINIKCLKAPSNCLKTKNTHTHTQKYKYTYVDVICTKSAICS